MNIVFTLKQISLVLLVLSFVMLFSCDSQEPIQQLVGDRNAAFLGDYAEYVVIDVKKARDGDYVAVEYAKKHPRMDTKEVVDGMVNKLDENERVKAYANVFQKKEGGYQCVIVYRKGVSQFVMDHERGHCMKRVLLAVIEKEAPDIYDSYAGGDRYGTYLSEGFAEIAAITRAYSLDGNFSYLSHRLIEIQRKASYQDGYKASIPLLLQARNFLNNTDKMPENVEAQIKFIVDKFYLPNVLTRDEFETGQWWTWLQ